MLEASRWRLTRGSAGMDIFDGDSGRRLGFARPVMMDAAGWRVWPRAFTVEICEEEDASQLFTMTRARWRRSRWTVRDAEDLHIGIIAGGRILTPWGRLLASQTSEGALVNPDGQVLGRLTGDHEAFHLALEPAEESPFWKMLALALAVLGLSEGAV